MRITFRTKLLGIVGIAAIGFLVLIVAGFTTATQVDTRLGSIQRSYLPKVELEPQLDAELEHMQRGFEDAVGAHDTEALAATRQTKTKLFELVDRSGSAVDPAQAVLFRAALEDYWVAADDVSRKLIRGETGEGVTESIIAMQAKQLLARDQIKKTAGLDRSEMTAAFESVSSAEKTAASTRLVVGVACLLLVLGLSLLASRGLIRSLDRVTDGFDRFGAGRFADPIRVEGEDELADLARNANTMAQKLDRVAEERDRIEAALQVSNRELEAFSYSVAHDLRAPLRGINGFSRALMEDWGGKLDDDARDQLERICAGAERMGHLIDALLSLSRVTRAQLTRDKVDLSRAAEGVLKQLQTTQPERKVEIEIADNLIVDGDPTLLRAVLENLLGNAWKFTAKTASPKIAFGAKAENESRVYFVQDNGAGFDMAYASKLFAPFQRLHAASDFAGTGVGLATVQRIVHRHGGRIWAEAAEGTGATFRFTLHETDGL